MKRDKLFFIDAEADGLNGSFISVAVIVTDMKCKELERAYYGITKNNLHVSDEWTINNVLPIIGEYQQVDNEDILLESVWKLWDKYKDTSYAVGDVIYPVEARLFQSCVYKNLKERAYSAPYPFIDISSLLYANGYDPLIPREQFEDDTKENTEMQHNALYDVELMIKTYKKIILK